MEEYLNKLNDQQRVAVEYVDGPSLVIAGAGSGKTRVLTYKIVYLLEHGYMPYRILALTFTNKAAQEIRERIEKTLNVGHIKMSISTVHSFCSRVLREECKAINYPSSFSIIDEDDQKKIIKDIIKEKEIDEKQLKISYCLEYISRKKNMGITPEEALSESEQK